MATTQAPELAPAEAPIALWLTFGSARAGSTAAAVGAVDPFAIFDAMQSAGVADVRRVGVLCTEPAHVAAARAAGAGAVVALGDPLVLTPAGPDVLVRPEELDRLLAERYGPDGTQRRLVLLNPGPALTSEAVKRAAGGADLCHREPEFRALDLRLRGKLRRLANLDQTWQIALLSGSGTAANEAAVRAAVRAGGRLLVVVNGVYGVRLRETAARAGIDVVAIDGAWTEPIEVAAVEAAFLEGDGFDALAFVHHETTTGLLNPVGALAQVAAASGAVTVVDAISSFGVEELDVQEFDFVTCTSNKCLHGLPGASFVLVSPTGARRAGEVEPSSVALDLGAYLQVEESGSPPFTPAIPALASLDTALDLALAEGIEGRRRRYAARCALLDGAIDRLGLEQLVAAPVRSHSIRSVRLPAAVTFEALHERLRADGFVVYAGQGALAAEIFRIACMGELELDDLRRFVPALERALAELCS
jgi:2-aminoethylphosphonate-pyruvate transaminase